MPISFKSRPSDTHILRQVTKKVRFGPKIHLHQVGGVPFGLREQQIYGEELKKIRKNLQDLNERKSKSEERRAALMTKARVLTISRRLGESQGGRRPSVYQVLAVVARKHGLDSDVLGKTANNMKNTEAKGTPLWDGTASNIASALRIRVGGKPLVFQVEQVLKSHNGALASWQIANRFGLSWTRKNMRRINTMMQLLDDAGYCRKLPEMIRGHPTSVWVHATQRNPAILYPNVSMEILNTLHIQGSQLLVGLYRTSEETSRKSGRKGNPNATFTITSVSSTVDKLVSVGLVESTRTRRRGRVRNQPVNHIKLTPLGQQLMDRYRASGRLPEMLRILVVGEKKSIDS